MLEGAKGGSTHDKADGASDGGTSNNSTPHALRVGPVVGAGTPGGGLRKWQCALQKVAAANAQEDTQMAAGGRVERRKSCAGGGHMRGGIKGLLEAAKVQKAKEKAEEEEKAKEEEQRMLKNSVPLGWSLGVFGPTNPLRIKLLKLVHHKVLVTLPLHYRYITVTLPCTTRFLGRIEP